MARHFGGAPTKRGFDNRKILLILSLFFLIMFIVLAVFLVKKGSSTEAKIVKPANNDVNLVSVLVPVRKIDRGEKLSQDMFQSELRSRFGLSEGAINEMRQIEGYYSKTLIVPGQPLYIDYMTKFQMDVITKKIPEGFRAVTIRVNDTTSVEGWAKPESIVDILWITRRSGKETIETIVERAEVLSAERTVENSQPGALVPSTVTLLVKAEDAKKVTLATTNGSLTLVLRNPEDQIPDSGVTIDSSDIGSSPKPAPRVIQRCTDTVVVGGKTYCVGARGNLYEQEDNN